MKRSFRISIAAAAVFVATLFLATSDASAQRRHPDRVKATKSATGKLAGFEQGDYMHAILKPARGESMSFFVGPTEALLYFLVAHQGQEVKVTYQEVSSWIEEAGGYTDIERVSAARTTAGMTHTTWWANERKKSSVATLRRKYDALLQKAVVNQ